MFSVSERTTSNSPKQEAQLPPKLADLNTLKYLTDLQTCGNLFGTLSSAGEYLLAFEALALGVYGIAEAFQFRGSMYDFGSGNGLVAALFAAAGFHAYGREILEESALAAEEFISLTTIKSLTSDRVFLTHGDCFDVSGEFLAALKIWYLYPACGMTPRVVQLYTEYASLDSALVMPSNSELRKNPHAGLPSFRFRGTQRFPVDFCVVAKQAETLKGISESMCNSDPRYDQRQPTLIEPAIYMDPNKFLG